MVTLFGYTCPLWALFLLWLILVATVVALFVLASANASSGLRWGGLAAILVMLIAFGWFAYACRGRTEIVTDKVTVSEVLVEESHVARGMGEMLERCRELNATTTHALADAQDQLKQNQTLVNMAHQETQACIATDLRQREEVQIANAEMHVAAEHLHDAKVQLQEVKEVNAQLVAANQRDRAEHVHLNNQMTNLQTQLEQAQQRAAFAQREAERLHVEMKSEHAEHQRAAAMAQAAESQLSRAQTELQRSQSEVTRLSSVITNARSDLQQAHSALAQTAALVRNI